MNLQILLSKLQNVRGGPQKFTARCPAHADTHNSLSVMQTEEEKLLLYCHAGCPLSDIMTKLNITPADLAPPRAHSENKMQICKKEPIPSSKTTETVYQYHDASNNILFEVVRREPKQFLQRRYEQGKLVYNLKGITPVLYQLPILLKKIAQGNAIIFVCEGEKDANRLSTLGFLATTAPMGAGKWHSHYCSTLKGAKQIILLPDNDKAGYMHALQILTALEQENIPAVVCDLKEIYPSLHEKGDVSDVLDSLGDSIAASFVNNTLSSSAYQKKYESVLLTQNNTEYQFIPTNTRLRTEFLPYLSQNAQQTPLKTGFKALDTQLEGHLYAGLYVVGSISSLGKTAFCLQMADYLASNGQDVLFFTLEMSCEEMIARSLTRFYFIQQQYKKSCTVASLFRGALSPSTLEPVLRAYEDGPGAHLMFLEGDPLGTTVEQIAQISLAHRATRGKSPVVFIDYLQILRTGDLRLSDKQATDIHVTRLKRLSRELCNPVIVVSSFNRQNYSETVNLASFKESGAIEYSADFVLGLQASGVSSASETPDERRAARLIQAATTTAKQQDPRPLEAITLKNRRGPASFCFSLDFYPKSNLFVES